MFSRLSIGCTPSDERYDGLETISSHLIPRRTYFDVRPQSDGFFFPYSRYPKKLASGSPVKILSFDVKFVTHRDFSWYYVATTPTQFGQSFLTVYHSQVLVVKRGTSEDAFAEAELGDRKLMKIDSQVFCMSEGGVAKIATKVAINGRLYPHCVVIAILGDFDFPSSAAVEVQNGKKLSAVASKIDCPVSKCSVTCTSLASLKLHYGRVHINSDDRIFRCAKCNRTFASQVLLTIHEQRMHSPESFKCPRCDKTYAQKHGLLRHMLLVHQP